MLVAAWVLIFISIMDAALLYIYTREHRLFKDWKAHTNNQYKQTIICWLPRSTPEGDEESDEVLCHIQEAGTDFEALRRMGWNGRLPIQDQRKE